MAIPEHTHRFVPTRVGVNAASETLYVLRCQCGQALQDDDGIPSDVRAILDNIRKGNADRYLEAILAAAHDRKRARHGTPGFPRSVSP